jgi:hypothetical protein
MVLPGVELHAQSLQIGDHLEDPSVDGRIILNEPARGWMGGGGGMEWIKMAQDRDRWRALGNAVMNLGVP